MNKFKHPFVMKCLLNGMPACCLFLLLSMITACTSEKEAINEKIIESIRDDHDFSETDYHQVADLIENDAKEFKSLLDSSKQVSPEKLAEYVKKLADSRKVAIERNAIWPSGKTAAHFTINVFLENSASIDGYVAGGMTKFKNAVYSLLMEMKAQNACDTMNLHYINTTIPYSFPHADNADVSDFIQTLDPATFRKRGGNRGSSDMNQVISAALSGVSNDRVSVLVTDCVYSPGKNAADIEYLNNQELNLKSSFEQKLKSQPVSVLLLQLESEFKGKYYDCKNAIHPLKGQSRPYYIFIMASPANMQALLEGDIISSIHGGILNQLLLEPADANASVQYKILPRPRTGNFSPDANDPRHAIADAEADEHKKQFSFAVAAAFTPLHLPDRYLCDSSSFLLSDTSFHIRIAAVINPGGPTAGYSHVLTISGVRPKNETLEIQLLARPPAWVMQSSSMNDTGIDRDTTELAKTFGLKFLVSGVFSAYQKQYTQAPSGPPGSFIYRHFPVTIKT